MLGLSVPLLQTHLPINAPRENRWQPLLSDSCPPRGEPHGGPGPWLQLGPALIGIGNWAMSQWMEDLPFALSLCLSNKWINTFLKRLGIWSFIPVWKRKLGVSWNELPEIQKLWPSRRQPSLARPTHSGVFPNATVTSQLCFPYHGRWVVPPSQVEQPHRAWFKHWMWC